MRVVIAPDSFKDALGAGDAAAAIAEGLRAVRPRVQTELCPITDGGEGFTRAFEAALGAAATRQPAAGVDPLGRTLETSWLRVDQPAGRVGVIELAAASGLERLAAGERDPMRTSTYGTGALLRQALDEGAGELLLGIGGSATNDGGCGIAQVLGVRFIDRQGEEISEPITGGMLDRIARIDTGALDPRLRRTRLRVACDVDNPLTGPCGAAHVYAPQKGASPEQVERLDAGLRHLAELWREQLGRDVEPMPGAGAAGGVGGGLVAMLGAELVPGAELVLDTVGFDERIKDADLVITGEGRLDGQSLQGKAVMAVARRAQAAGVPCVALVGSVGEGAERALAHGLAAYRVIGEGLAPAESIARTAALLSRAARELARERLL